MCGGTRWPLPVKGYQQGLSPRVRGNRTMTTNRNDCSRSIPACAGEPLKFAGKLNYPRVYPRVCGGTRTCQQIQVAYMGLSPRVRGNRMVAEKAANLAGSIPACAGEPNYYIGHGGRETVYPRVCGGTPSSQCNPFYRQGLSPRVRGNPEHRADSPYTDRSIPACAGEPRRQITSPTYCRVYPRVCGGTDWTHYAMTFGRGLSPRVRGNPHGRRLTEGGTRSIPACAGEPCTCFCAPFIRPVYPRVCGGTRCRE